MKCTSFAFDLEFRHPFTISRGTKTHQPTLVVQLENNGITGYGEAPAITYYNIPVAKMREDILAHQAMIEKFFFTDPERYWHYLHHLISANNFLVCALDIAGWDLFGKMRNKPLHAFWSKAPVTPVTDYTIGIDTIDKMVEKMLQMPWPVYKIKLGTDQDLAIMEALRKHTGAIFRVDANAAWTAPEALQKIPVLKELGVELVEQPLAKDDWDGMKQLYNESSLPLIADESCVREADVQKCYGHFHGINIKLTKCSGITPARKMISKARELDMKVMLGSMNESSIGSAAIAHLSPLADYLDMDGPLLLREDLATGLEFDQNLPGQFIMPATPGLGIQYTGKIIN